MDTTLLAPEKKSPPWVDTSPLVYDPADPTKLMRVDVGAVATGNTRILTMGDRNVDLSAGGTFAELVHASQHQHGGADEIATATPGANAIPKAGSGGTLASGWIPDLSATYQPLDATLTALAGVTTAADKLIYATASDTFATTDLTSFARTLLDDTTAANAATTLGLGTASAVTHASLLATDGSTLGLSNGENIVGIKTFTDTSGNKSVLGIQSIATPSASSTMQARALTFVSQVTGSNNLTNSTAGQVGMNTALQHLGTGVVTHAANILIGAPFRTSTGTWTACSGIKIQGQKAAGVTTGYAINAEGNSDMSYFNHPLILGQASAEPTPGTNQAAIYAYDVAGTAEMKVVDEAANRTQISPHPQAVIDNHDALMQSLGLKPVSVPWGYESDQDIAGVRVAADIAAALRCVEWLMLQAGKPVELIREEKFEPKATWEAAQQIEHDRWAGEAADYDRQITRWVAQPFWVRDQLEKPSPVRNRPPVKTQPTWLDRSIEKASAI